MSIKQLENCDQTSVSGRRYEQNQVVKTFGQRMKEAREIANMTQITAAKRLGYSNSSKLAKIELASDTNSIPLWLVPKAAKLYSVSIDFLFGISDDWERDPVVSQQRVIGDWLFEHFERSRMKEINAFRVLQNKIVAIEKAVSHVIGRSKENLETMQTFRDKNPEFDDMKLGAKLLRLMAETAEEADGISHELKRFRAFVDVANKTEGVNLDIFRDGE
jgi:transcriptional regulator with XRE-family HTH domain